MNVWRIFEAAFFIRFLVPDFVEAGIPDHNVGLVMSTVSDVIAFLECVAPPALAEDWDNVGLLVGRRDSVVQNVLTCLTLTPDVAEEVIRKNVQMVVTHHPVLFRGAKKICDATVEGRMLLRLVENKVAVYSPHTSFDSAAGGINQQLAESFGLKSVKPIRPLPEDAALGGGRWGILQKGGLLAEFLSTVKAAVCADYLQFTGTADAAVFRVAVACGAAAGFMQDSIRLGCDTFVTGEARFHSAVEARAEGINLILLGHYSSERPAVESLAEVIQRKFPTAKVFVSLQETDPLSVFVQ